MTTEETELTFVRCPSCRSLVPAVASRCRMCGFQFEAADGESVDSADVSGKSRVRQKTVSVSKQDVDGIVQTAVAEANAASNQQVDSESFPLTESFNEPDAPVAAEQPTVSDDIIEDLSSSFSQAAGNPSPVDQLISAPVDPFVATPASPEPTPLVENEEIPQPEPAKSDFDEPEQQEAISAAPVDSENSSEEKPEGRKRRRRKRKRKSTTETHSADDRVGATAEPDRDVTLKEAVEESKKESDMATEPSSTEERKSDRGKSERSPQPNRTIGNADGTLIGWFVNFEQDTKGRSFELRSGRFFVGSKSLRATDLVIADTAVSTPHCLVTVGDESLIVQDLMSEKGTFVKRRGERSFGVIDESAEIHHGDQLRFGAYVVTVCLVP